MRKLIIRFVKKKNISNMSKLSKNIEPRNDKGQKHGYWEEYYFNGQLKYKGNYYDGKRHGYREEYYLCSQLNFKCKYVNDDRHGYFEKYWSNGQLMYTGHYVNGDRHGYWEKYYSNSEVYYKGYFDMDKKVDYEVLIDSPPKEMFPIY